VLNKQERKKNLTISRTDNRPNKTKNNYIYRKENKHTNKKLINVFAKSNYDNGVHRSHVQLMYVQHVVDESDD